MLTAAVKVTTVPGATEDSCPVAGAMVIVVTVAGGCAQAEPGNTS
jgi:hypothetical protein